MIYNLSNEYQRKQAILRFKKLLDRGVVVDLSEKVQRTPSQNRYLHLIIGAMAMETGVTLEYAKEWYFKRIANRELFVREVEDKFAGKIEVVRSSTELTREEMALAIDKFKNWAREQGYYLPNPEDLGLLQEIEIEMGGTNRFL